MHMQGYLAILPWVPGFPPSRIWLMLAPDELGALGGVDGGPDARLLVVVDDRARLGVVRRETLLERLGVVVRSLNQRLARHVVGHALLRRVDFGASALTS